RDRICSRNLDSSLKTLGLTVLKTPRKTPQACDLRALDRKCASRVFRFHDSDQRDPHSANAPVLGRPLQSRPPAFQPWTRNTGSPFHRKPSCKSSATVFQKIAESLRNPFLLGCITNTAWRKSRHDGLKTPECIFCGAQGICGSANWSSPTTGSRTTQ